MIQDLLEKMRSVYEVLLKTQDLEKDEDHWDLLSRLSIQTKECAEFIAVYAGEPRFCRWQWGCCDITLTFGYPTVHRLLNNATLTIRSTIDDYFKAFDRLLAEFRDSAVGITVVKTTRTLSLAEDLCNLRTCTHALTHVFGLIRNSCRKVHSHKSDAARHTVYGRSWIP